MPLLHMTAVYSYMLYYVRSMNLIIILIEVIWLSTFSETTALSWFQTVLD